MENNCSGISIPSEKSKSKWQFDKNQLECTPSRKCGISSEKELLYRQQSASFIQDIGHHLRVNQLCMNTAIVFMHRFYMHHSFSHFHRNDVSPAALYLATKVEEQPRKLEHVVKAAYCCLYRDSKPPIDMASSKYLDLSNSVITTENFLLQTLGFEMRIDHPHIDVAICCQTIRACRELSQASYFLATQSHHLTTFCLQYDPKLVACVCIHFACKWSGYTIPPSKMGRDWFYYVDKTVTIEQLETLTHEFLTIFKQSPTRIKSATAHLNQISNGNSFDANNLSVQSKASKNIAQKPKYPYLQQSSSSKILKTEKKDSIDSQQRFPTDPHKKLTTELQIIAMRRDHSSVFSKEKYSHTKIPVRNDLRPDQDQPILVPKEIQPLTIQPSANPMTTCPLAEKKGSCIDSLIRGANKRKLSDEGLVHYKSLN